jgi:hypothetical protein
LAFFLHDTMGVEEICVEDLGLLQVPVAGEPDAVAAANEHLPDCGSETPGR